MEEQEREEDHLVEKPVPVAAPVTPKSCVRGTDAVRNSPETSPLKRNDDMDERNEQQPPKEISTTQSMDRNEQIRMPNPAHRRPRKTNNTEDDGRSLSNSSDEFFEDEPDKSLPKPSPNRLAARRERRRSTRKQQKFDETEGGNLSKVDLALPHLRAFRKEGRQKDDDESSHWSSSDGEHVEDRRRDAAQWLSQDDIEICRRLDEEYERALEEREVVYTARYNSVRQSACFSVFFMLLYLSLGAIFFQRQANWTVSESILFSIYTITTVGCTFWIVDLFISRVSGG